MGVWFELGAKKAPGPVALVPISACGGKVKVIACIERKLPGQEIVSQARIQCRLDLQLVLRVRQKSSLILSANRMLNPVWSSTAPAGPIDGEPTARRKGGDQKTSSAERCKNVSTRDVAVSNCIGS